ncbi:rab5 GDP/GTP exchange factor-like [Teleopsis dalmanni]|uniref:rab5 GDP/GTP exchange factor-like n=1 Tax=Teleopsis dalmanni TaxID=139649 RepID=UPI0018CF8637|nr:rab5 GDP/GTP exchange factor-like [Teleopsis dalmanni]
MTSRVPQLRLSASALKCKQGCGFYGNSQFEGLCSKCFRERNDKKKKQNLLSSSTAFRIDPNLPKTSDGSVNSSLVAGRLSPKNLLNRSPSKKQDEATSSSGTSNKKKSLVPYSAIIQKTLQSTTQKTRKHKNEEQQTVIQDKPHIPDATEKQFILQFKQLRVPDDGKRVLKDEVQRLDGTIRSYMNSNANKNVEELSELVQNAYTKFADTVHNNQIFQIATNEDRESAIDFFEKAVMTQNHKFLFSPYFTTDEEKDAEIQRRIRQLSWITAKHLACSIDEVNAESRDLVYNANWFKATQYCRYHGMHLASISSQEENDRLEKHIQDFGLGHEHFWISGTDLADEGNFFWMATGRPITFTNWNAGEPNNFRYENGEEENCLELWNRDGKGLKWNDSPCSFETYFVCEVQPN